MTERKTGATPEIPEFVLLAAEALRSAALKEAQAIAPYGYAVVSVADLRVQCAGLMAFRDFVVSLSVNRKANGREGEFTYEEAEAWEAEAKAKWNDAYPELAQQIDRIAALIGDGA